MRARTKECGRNPRGTRIQTPTLTLNRYVVQSNPIQTQTLTQTRAKPCSLPCCEPFHSVATAATTARQTPKGGERNPKPAQTRAQTPNRFHLSRVSPFSKHHISVT